MQHETLVSEALKSLEGALASDDVVAVRQALWEAVPGYLPSGQEADLTSGAGKDGCKKESRSAS